MTASTYTAENILNALMRGQPFAAGETWVSLHTADPGLDGAHEAAATDWPSYQRRSSWKGETAPEAWSEADDDNTTWNQNQIIFQVFDGPRALTVTHVGLFDAETGGNFLAGAKLHTPRMLYSEHFVVFDGAKLGVQVE